MTFFIEDSRVWLTNEFSDYTEYNKEEPKRWGKNVDDYLDTTDSFLLLHLPWELTVYNFREILERGFIHIGIMENLQDSVNVLAKKLGKESLDIGMENVSPRTETPSPGAIERWKERHRLEYSVYEYARMHQEKTSYMQYAELKEKPDEKN